MIIMVVVEFFKNIKLNKSKNDSSDLDKLDIFEKYRSSHIDIAYFQYHQTASMDVEASSIKALH